METLITMVIVAGMGSILAHAMNTYEMRQILKQEGIQHQTPLVSFIDLIIIFLFSCLLQVAALNMPEPVMMLSGLFGAFFAASAWSDAKTGWVPDFSIVPTLTLGLLTAWCWNISEDPGAVTVLLIILGSVCLFGALIWACLNLSWFKVTPPDMAFVILIVTSTSEIPQMFAVLIMLIASILLVRTRPHWVRIFMPKVEQDRLTKQMEAFLDLDEGHMQQKGWYPLGPIALLCVTVGYCVNALF